MDRGLESILLFSLLKKVGRFQPCFSRPDRMQIIWKRIVQIVPVKWCVEIDYFSRDCPLSRVAFPCLKKRL